MRDLPFNLIKRFLLLIFTAAMMATASGIVAAQAWVGMDESFFVHRRPSLRDMAVGERGERGERFVSTGANFSIALPPDFTGRNLSGPGIHYVSDTAEAHFWIYRYFDTGQKTPGLDTLLKFAKEDLARKHKKFALLSESLTPAGNYPGFEINYTAPTGDEPDEPVTTYIQRTVVSGADRYILKAALKKNDEYSIALVRRALDSFAVLSAAENAAEISRQMAAIADPKLPQTPAVPRPTSDAEDHALKGPVSSVVFEPYPLPGGPALPPGNTVQTHWFFDQLGGLIKQARFDAGRDLDQMIFYGNIDGVRVALSTGRSDSWYKISARIPDPTTLPLLWRGPPAAADPRYSTKFRYFYDSKNRLREQRYFSNRGQPTIRIEYAYGEKTVSKKIFNSNYSPERLAREEIATLDDNDNEIAGIVKYYSFTGEAKWGVQVETHRTYTFDSVDRYGNWTVRTTTLRNVKIDGSPGDPFVQREKRTISYYR